MPDGLCVYVLPDVSGPDVSDEGLDELEDLSPVHLQVEEVRLLDQGDQPVLGHGFFL